MDASSPHIHQVTATVVLPESNPASLVLGVIATFFGAVALGFSWIPFIGMLAIPAACIGGLLALIGLVVAACHRFKSWLMPVIGGALCLCAILMSVLSTGVAGAAMSEDLQKQKAIHEAQEKKIRQAFDSPPPQASPPPKFPGHTPPPGLKF